VIDAYRPSLVVADMPQQPRGSKRKHPPEEMPSSQTLEFVDDDVLPAPGSQADPSVPMDGASEEASSDAASQSVSVSSTFARHVIPTDTP
jgi:hypothetical protein